MDAEIRLSVQEGLALMADAFKDLDEVNMNIMEALLMEAIDKVQVLTCNYSFSRFCWLAKPHIQMSTKMYVPVVWEHSFKIQEFK